jgi:hypothetical protein
MSNYKTPLELLFTGLADKGFKKPTLRSEHLKYKLAPATGNNPGAVYITDNYGTYLGKLKHGNISLLQSSREVVAEIVDTMENPKEAAVKYGRKTGQCAICGRPLDNKLSVALGIGPICNERFGWELPEEAIDTDLDFTQL